MILTRKALYSACLSAALGLFAFVPSAFANGSYTGKFFYQNTGTADSPKIECASLAADYANCVIFTTANNAAGKVMTLSGNSGLFIPDDGVYTTKAASSGTHISSVGTFAHTGGGAGGVTVTVTISDPYVPPPPVTVYTTVAASEAGFASTTGTTVAGAVLWTGDNLVKVFAGSGLAVLYELRLWIVALIIIALLVYFAYRGFRFFRH